MCYSVILLSRISQVTIFQLKILFADLFCAFLSSYCSFSLLCLFLFVSLPIVHKFITEEPTPRGETVVPTSEQHFQSDLSFPRLGAFDSILFSKKGQTRPLLFIFVFFTICTMANIVQDLTINETSIPRPYRDPYKLILSKLFLFYLSL